MAVCKYCNAELKYQNGSISNLQYHYNNFHLPAQATPSQPLISDSLGQPRQYSRGSQRHILLQKSVAEFIIDDLRPFLTVRVLPSPI